MHIFPVYTSFSNSIYTSFVLNVIYTSFELRLLPTPGQ